MKHETNLLRPSNYEGTPNTERPQNNLLLLFSVFDIKAEAYLLPFNASTEGLALRMLSAAANDQDHQFHQHAEDFSLWRVGTFDQNSGKVVPDEIPKCLAKAFDLIKPATISDLREAFTK